MRDYGRVYTRFWSSEDVRSLSDDGRLLALYLLTCEHTTLVGLLRLPDGYATEDLKWTSERVREGFHELSRNGFANRCETTKWVWVRKFLTWNAPENPNQWKAARKITGIIPANCSWLFEFQQVFAAAAGDSPPSLRAANKPSANPPETLSKPVSVSVSVSGTVAEAGSVSQNARVPLTTVSRETNITPLPGTRLTADVPDNLREAVKAAYPPGLYRQSDWMLAERELRTRLEEGASADEILAEIGRYANQAAARASVGTQYIFAPSRFLRERMFLEPFPLPAKPPTATEELLRNIERAAAARSGVIEHDPDAGTAAAG